MNKRITVTKATEEKLSRLLRYHRQHCFSSDAHCRAIARLKNTPTAKAIFNARHEALEHAKGQRLLYTYA